ncbi:5-(carboxyamino)imidazole ribonucleotide synthase [Corynebacterium yudongzhengii]|uniref:N5-carboxyaminoimidazole ribonucleotide synthase n=2 Tax=Corynebacterium yudongzhengii TaxID=2080740 RepID=A0A2U1T771_9CORY|nr:5-(carboxyamino)imidazole ribonucleotide synthase [Corynebacterium yudongzhengii]PWC01850.1 5-(carboxyamino)imidazole ribonucleotide synthase [Corynebacterium yudongzhengii]
MPVITVIGDGQLARMLQTAAIELGASLRVLAAKPDASAAQVSADVRLGDYKDLDDVRLAIEGSDAVTFDHEHVPNEHANKLIDAGFNLQPQPAALIHAQDKLVMREKMKEISAPVPPFAAIESVEDATAFFDEVDGAVCLKARRGGYDGHGVWFPSTREEVETLVEKLLGDGVPLMAEKKLAFTRELSAMVARTPSGEARPWPVVQSRQENGICVEATAPAPDMSDELRKRCEVLSVTIAEELGVAGVLAVELFEYLDDNREPTIAVNELAMRPHNTGHWTQDGSVTSQFEQHLRAVLDLPLGDTATLKPVTVMVNTLGADASPEMPVYQRVREVMARFPEAKIHLYGKDHRPGRKLGHVNVTGEDLDNTREIAELAAHFIVHAEWRDGYSA